MPVLGLSCCLLAVDWLPWAFFNGFGCCSLPLAANSELLHWRFSLVHSELLHWRFACAFGVAGLLEWTYREVLSLRGARRGFNGPVGRSFCCCFTVGTLVRMDETLVRLGTVRRVEFL